MCTGGRVVNYLKSLLGDERTDVVFVGYQAEGTPGRALRAGNKQVTIDGKHLPVQARVHNLSGYSAHADQADLLRFVGGFVRAQNASYWYTARQGPKRVLRKKLPELAQ